MSLASQTAPQPDEHLLAALRVPLFLITLGGLFLAEDYLGWPISRTWPILLILWGALLIAARRRRAL